MILPIAMTACVVIFAKGIAIAMDWTDPFTGRYDQVAKVVNTPKKAVAVGVLSVWPYFLVLASSLLGIAYALMLGRNLRTSN